MTTQSPDQSSSQSPAPPKEMEDFIQALAARTLREMMAEAMPGGVLVKAFTRLAAELGKEREAERAESDKEWVRYSETATASLKRELADLEELYRLSGEDLEVACEDASNLRAKNLALSASYQRLERENEELKGPAK